MSKVKLILVFLFISITYSQQIAKTSDGKSVILNENGTWQYLTNNTSKQKNNNEYQVYITYTGKRYHKDGCRYLKSRIPSTISEATSKGLTPCKVCRPPSSNQSYSSPSTSIKKSSDKVYSNRCQATTQKGTQCKRNAQSGGSYCWQHP